MGKRRTQRRRITDDQSFALMWDNQEISVTAIAEYFKVGRRTVHVHAERLHLAMPKPKPPLSATAYDGYRKVKADPEPIPVPPQVRKQAFEAPGWTARRDQLIIETGGSYAGIANYAKLWELPARRVMMRWHQIRDMG